MREVLRTIFAYPRRHARRLGARPSRARSNGAVTFVQRFNSALELSLHFHVLVPDGVFVGDGDDPDARPRRLEWSTLIKRAYQIDVLVCPRCKGPMRLITLIEDERVAKRILAHLGLPARAPPRGRPWRPAQPPWPLDTTAADD